MIKYFLLYFLITIVGLFVVDFKTVLVATVVYFIGMGLVFVVNARDKINIVPLINIYQIVYIVGFSYICICYLYMESHGYEYLLAWDIPKYFMPRTEAFLEYGSISAAEAKNWSGFSFFSRYHSGYFGYLIPFAYFSSNLDANLYVSMQFSTLLIASFGGVVIYRLLLVNFIDPTKAYKYTLLICLCSVLFFYSTQLLRDVHIMFLSLLGIYLTFREEFSIINLAKIVSVIVIVCTFRIESGLFLFSLVPIYLMLSMQGSRKKSLSIFMSVIISLGGIIFSSLYFNQITDVLLANNEFYLDSDKGDGVIGSLQRIPIAGNILSVVYNAIQPLPFWAKYDAGLHAERPEMYNIMTFPLSFASLFNWIVLFFISVFLFHKATRVKVSRSIRKPLLYQLYLGVVFLYIQSAVIDQRRLMAYYVVFYILFYIIYTTLAKRERGNLMFCAFAGYASLQLFASLYR